MGFDHRVDFAQESCHTFGSMHFPAGIAIQLREKTEKGQMEERQDQKLLQTFQWWFEQGGNF